MKISVTTGDALQQETPLLALATWSEQTLPQAIAGLVEDGDWSGKAGQTQLLYPKGAIPARRLLLIGLGKPGAGAAERLREAGASATRRARELGADRFSFAMPEAEGLDAQAAAQALAEGLQLGDYRFLHYKSDRDDSKPGIADVTLVTGGASDAAAQGVAVGQAVAQGVALARDLANRPSNDLPPAQLAEAAREVGERYGMGVTILGREELEAQGFGGIIGVGKGSANEPRFIVLEHGQKREGVPTICLVGKGITFDSGGISIKPAEGMDNMKMDMGGAAAVVGAMEAVGALNLPIHVVGLIASAENMPSATAYKPGDILKTLSGKTIEVLNTDAEGRIVLADALHYAQRYEPTAVIDLATLTGAIMVALGPHAIGMMSNDDDLSARLARAGEQAGERAWRMPLWEPYSDMIKSEIADVKNTGGRYGGAITAAAFLQHFVGNYPWAHLDIAGTAWVDRQTKPYQPKGATGVGVRLLIAALREWANAA